MGAPRKCRRPQAALPGRGERPSPGKRPLLHLGFIRAGADVIEANTFGANRRKLAEHYLEDDLVAINEAAVKIARDAREVSGRDVFIAGSIGPLGDAGDPGRRRLLSSRSRQRLEGRGVDLFMVETFYDLDELQDRNRRCSRRVLAAHRRPADLRRGRPTLGGVSAEDAAAALETQDVAAIGANHGLGLQAALRAIERMGGSGKPLAALPNVGLASLAGQRIVFPHATPDYFAEFAAHARELSTYHRGLLRHDTDRDRRDSPRRRRGAKPECAARRAAPRDRRRGSGARERDAATAKAARPEFVVSVEIDPPRGGTPRRCSTSLGH